MKWNLLPQIISMSKYALFGIFVQALLCSILLAEPSHAQKTLDEVYLSINLKSAEVKEIFAVIEEKTDFKFTYQEAEIEKNTLSISFTNGSLGDILRYVSENTKFAFKRINQNINVTKKRKRKSAGLIEIVQPNQHIVSGKVVSSEDGEPLPGVSILIKGTTKGTNTNIDGEFSLNVNKGDHLQFSFIGYKSHEVEIINQTVIDVSLDLDLEQLEEIVVVGYGTVRKGDITGAISSVSTKDIQELPVTNAGQALQGRATGVVALSNGNRPGDGVTIRIRGRRSLTATNEPLFVVDGIPFQGNINSINPKDIKSMEILKDASATAIYGSRGANGVILVTTNRGGEMNTTVSYNAHYGVVSVIGLPDMMNGPQYTRLKEVGGRAFTAAELEAIDRGVSTDWLDLVVDDGHQQNHQLSVIGGSTKTGFAVSANYFNEQGVLSIQNYDRYTFRVNLDHQVSKKLKIGTSTQISNEIQNLPSNPYGGALNISPLAEPYDANGELIYRPGADPLLWNPLADFDPKNVEDNRKTLRLFSNIFGEYEFVKGLNYRMNFGTDLREYRRGLFQGTNSSARQGGDARVYKEHEREYVYTFENILTYSKKFSNIHDLKFTGLYSIQESNFEETIVDANLIPYEHQKYHNIGTAEAIQNYDSDLREWGITSVMARVNYGLKNRYLLTLTGRWDGSSRLAEGNKWGFFPSAALMWRIKDEGFMANQGLFNDLRLRSSYGIVGNTGIDPYQTRGSLSRTTYSFGSNSAYGYSPGAISNPDLRWESSATFNIGLDFGIFGDRLSGSLEYYQTSTTDLLLERQIPITSGFNSVLENVGETKNKGWEVALTYQNAGLKDFLWSTTLNLFGNKEEIIDLYGTGVDDIGNQWFIGHPLTVWYDYEKLGIWQTEESDAADVYKQVPGQIKVKDQNEDGIINQDDRVILGSNIPTVTLGWSSRFEFKGVDFSWLVLGVMGHTIYNNFEVGNATLQGRYNNLNIDFWTEDNPTNNHPKPDGSRESPIYASSRGYYKGNFVKIKNLQLGYTLPQDLTAKIGINRLRVYLNANTPVIWSRLENNLDPEVYDGEVEGFEPSTKMYSLGVNVDF
ncbi:SusC/RagA family TonB-linked outer membrane protein [Flexithrix dorotheae]|uniref:SusC/RagA family TonB-linked outer membrane protein n=1 Tax=Flexithrix dorotheae TaxID=70993 RepID=UPI00039BED3C|nr:TonB-dependent receptor [Flexithrix dorotheae]